MKVSKKIRRDIQKYLAETDKPASTREIALKIDRAWHSVQLNCMKLQLAEKIKGMKIGNMNVWTVKDER